MEGMVKKIEKIRKVGLVDYKSGKTPEDYKCEECGATGVKLWREYQTIATFVTLRCAKCAGKHSNVDVSRMDEQGSIPSDVLPGDKTDNIGWLVPAIPVEGQDTYWGYTSVPQEGCDWWYGLPNR